MFMDFVGQKFRQGTEGMACVCCITSGASVARLKGWALEWPDGSLAWKSGSGWRWGSAVFFPHGPLHMASLFKLVWASRSMVSGFPGSTNQQERARLTPHTYVRSHMASLMCSQLITAVTYLLGYKGGRDYLSWWGMTGFWKIIRDWKHPIPVLENTVQYHLGSIFQTTIKKHFINNNKIY